MQRLSVLFLLISTLGDFQKIGEACKDVYGEGCPVSTPHPTNGIEMPLKGKK